MNTKKIDILIVDDNQFYRKGLILMLKRICTIGKILEANNGNEFMHILNNNRPDLILMDIKMPGMDGITATKKAIELDHMLKIIALTMFYNKEYLMEMILAGAKGFLLKDSNEHELSQAIYDVLSGKNYYAKKAVDNMSFLKE